MRILIGGIVQESNTFSPMVTTVETFKDNFYAIGEGIYTLRGARNEIGGFFAAAEEENAEVIPTFYASAVSSGKLEEKAYYELKELLVSQISKQRNYDGVLLAFHGALVSEKNDDPEGQIIREVRDIIGENTPLVISLDAHANVTKKMVDNVNGIIGYRTYPHVDHYETGYKAAKMLFTIIRENIKPYIALKKVPMILPAETTQFSDGPMGDLWKEAKSRENTKHSWVTSLFPVQPWLDVDELGFGVVVVTKEASVDAENEAQRLAEYAWDIRHKVDVELFSIKEAVEKAFHNNNNPIIISDSADGTGAGSPGDSNFVLKKLLELNVQKELSCLLCIVDKPAVEIAIESGIGSSVNLNIGHSIDKKHGKPISIKGEVSRIGDGKFSFGKGFPRELEANMGKCVVIKIDKISLLVSEKAVFTFDPAMYRSMGLEPTNADLVLVKSANQFRSSYKDISSQIYILDTPGSSTANLKTLNFNKIKRPFYPFDDNFDWKI